MAACWLAGLNLTLFESRRAVGLEAISGAPRSRGSCWVRRTAKERLNSEKVVDRLRTGQTVLKQSSQFPLAVVGWVDLGPEISAGPR